MAEHLIITAQVLRRSRELVEREPALVDAMASLEDLEAIRAGRSSIEHVKLACERYANRPCFGMRPPRAPAFETITYGEIWERVTALATGFVALELVQPGELVGICGGPSADWVVADLACLYRGAVSVPVQLGMPDADLHHVLAETRLSTLVCSPLELPRIAAVIETCPWVSRLIVMTDAERTHAAAEAIEVLRRTRTVLEMTEVLHAGRTRLPAEPHVPAPGADPLVMIMYSSGTTGRPKGVMFSERRSSGDLRAALQWPAVPMIQIGFLQLTHIAGRGLLFLTMMHGGVTNFTAHDMSRLFEDVRLVRPTMMPAPPRVSSMVSQHFLTELARRGVTIDLAAALEHPVGKAVMAEMRTSFFGDRLCLVRTGTARTAPEVHALLERCFGVRVTNEYGQTETGSLAVDGHVRPNLEIKLADLPELGYTTHDRPYPRGELLARWPGVTRGYFNNAEATAALFDADGYVRTGDVVEERGPREIAWIDRKSSVVRLAQGEFVNVSRLETLAATSPFIRQLFVNADPRHAYVLAVIVPAQGADRRRLRVELDRIARAAQLPRHEVPRDFVIAPEPFTVENQLLTSSGKLNRAKLGAAFGPQLAELYAAIETRQVRSAVPDREVSVVVRVQTAIAAALGLPEHEIDRRESEIGFVGYGGDSFNAVRLCAMLEEALGVSVPVATVLDPAVSVAALVARVEELVTAGPDTLGYAAVHGPGEEVHATELDLARFVPHRAPAQPSPIERPPRVVLLTGANGFLGRSVLLALSERLPRDGQIVCLVRGTDDEAARERLRAAVRPGNLARLDELWATGRLAVHASNLMHPRLGLPDAIYDGLCDRVDAIVHGGALVNHALSYRELFAPNVLGTVELVRLATNRRKIPIHFISTLGVAARRASPPVLEIETAEELWPSRPIGSTTSGDAIGYVTSKWACEILLRQLHERDDVPVHIYRCGMILPHRRHPDINHGDNINRLLHGLLRTGVAPSSFYADPGAPPRYDGIPVDLVAAAIAAITVDGRSGFQIYHLSNADVRPTISLDHIVGWVETAGIALERLPYAAWLARFRERLEQLDPAGRAASPLSTLARWEHPIRATQVPDFDARMFRARLHELLGEHVPAVDEPYVHRWVRALDAV